MTSSTRWLLSVPASWLAGVLCVVIAGTSGLAGDRIPLSEAIVFAIVSGVLHAAACIFLYLPVIMLLRSKQVFSPLAIGTVTALVGVLPLLALARLWGGSAANAVSPEGILFGSCFVPAAAAFGALNTRR